MKHARPSVRHNPRAHYLSATILCHIGRSSRTDECSEVDLLLTLEKRGDLECRSRYAEDALDASQRVTRRWGEEEELPSSRFPI